MAAERLVVPGQAAGERLDRLLSTHLGLPRNQVQRWIAEGRVRVAGSPGRASTRVEADAVVEWEAPEPAGEERVLPEPPGDEEIDDGTRP